MKAESALLLLGLTLAVFYGRLEILDAFAEALAKFRQSSGTKNEQCDGENNKDLGKTQFA
jgi:hypothetical protein